MSLNNVSSQITTPIFSSITGIFEKVPNSVTQIILTLLPSIGFINARRVCRNFKENVEYSLKAMLPRFVELKILKEHSKQVEIKLACQAYHHVYEQMEFFVANFERTLPEYPLTPNQYLYVSYLEATKIMQENEAELVERTVGKIIKKDGIGNELKQLGRSDLQYAILKTIVINSIKEWKLNPEFGG